MGEVGAAEEFVWEGVGDARGSVVSHYGQNLIMLNEFAEEGVCAAKVRLVAVVVVAGRGRYEDGPGVLGGLGELVRARWLLLAVDSCDCNQIY